MTYMYAHTMTEIRFKFKNQSVIWEQEWISIYLDCFQGVCFVVLSAQVYMPFVTFIVRLSRVVLRLWAGTTTPVFWADCFI